MQFDKLIVGMTEVVPPGDTMILAGRDDDLEQLLDEVRTKYEKGRRGNILDS